MRDDQRYIIDADVFITAKNSYYPFDFCPGFWSGVLRSFHGGRVCSIERVHGELMAGRKEEDLVKWAREDLPAAFFEEVDGRDVTERYTEIMLWSQRHPQYLDAAKAKFATGADGWLVAFAMARGGIVVTNERPAPQSLANIKLPDVCDQFGVSYRNTFQMLRDLAVRFELAAG